MKHADLRAQRGVPSPGKSTTRQSAARASGGATPPPLTPGFLPLRLTANDPACRLPSMPRPWPRGKEGRGESFARPYATRPVPSPFPLPPPPSPNPPFRLGPLSASRARAEGCRGVSRKGPVLDAEGVWSRSGLGRAPVNSPRGEGQQRGGGGGLGVGRASSHLPTGRKRDVAARQSASAVARRALQTRCGHMAIRALHARPRACGAAERTLSAPSPPPTLCPPRMAHRSRCLVLRGRPGREVDEETVLARRGRGEVKGR